LLREYAGHGGTVVMATHDVGFAAAAGARLMLIADGRPLGRSG
jgi:ABC-type ATPase involved in cell division